MVDLDAPIGQARFAELVGCSRSSAKALVAGEVLVVGATAREWIVGYTAGLRLKAAGQASDASLTELRTRLTTAKAALAKHEFDVQQGRLVPISMLGDAMSSVVRQAMNRLDALVPDLRVRFPALSSSDFETIGATVAEARNRSAAASRASSLPQPGRAIPLGSAPARKLLT